ncbi:hypothetical protein L228DRAFT_279660 [Xylona heveae TC161]|uniref:Prion-inhibition and propagation HeLo domain-containing protein n=1 Tax=Xylona heveae (strain CBS 132557 / TC161) TaxID=1328760 RepID=A0A165JNV2_XYLHT|nr:hypothetical protein L228DRAFT_279660 [Xylona heveae TC161]KZF26463.1 hypothetical protein L228DRAFT_279660 [Xylona heveae TC161]
MEVAGFALSVAGGIGLLGQIFDGCLKAYKVFSTASNLGRDSERLICKIRIEEMRLMVWGREWGVVEGRLEAHLAAAYDGNVALKALAENILRELYNTITDFNKLQDRYGLRDESTADLEKTIGNKAVARGLREELKLRARWVVTDKDKFELLLQDLKDFNDGLEKLFPPTRIATLQRTWTHELLDVAQRDVAQLGLLERASDGIYPSLNTFAKLKQLRINLEEKEPTKKIMSTSTLKIPRESVVIPTTNIITDGKRSYGSYIRPVPANSNQKPKLKSFKSKPASSPGAPIPEDVLIEFIEYDSSMDMDARLILYQRVFNLASMTQNASLRHPDLHTLDCYGYFDDPSCERYGLVYKNPQTEPLRTLTSLVEDPNIRTPDLDERIRLAHTLAIALWSCHSLDWLHKTFCSFNILFPHASDDSSDSSDAKPETRPSKSEKEDSKSSKSSKASSPPSSRSSTPSAGKPTTATTNGTTNGTTKDRSPSHPSANTTVSLSNCYVTGFDSSRPEHLDEMTVASKNEIGQDLYRHPDSLGVWRQSYCKAYDIYSLGLVLLEIGLWKSLRVYYKSKYNPKIFRDKVVLPVLVPGLGAKTGSLYRRVVEACLVFPEREGKEYITPHQMMEWIVQTLESLKV